MRRRQPEPACRRGGPDSGSHLQGLFFLKIQYEIPGRARLPDGQARNDANKHYCKLWMIKINLFFFDFSKSTRKINKNQFTEPS